MFGEKFCVVALVLLGVAAQCYAAGPEAAFLDYGLLGSDWGEGCEIGEEQSPINIDTKDVEMLKHKGLEVQVKGLGKAKNCKSFVTETLPHVEVVWEKFVKAPEVTVAASKKNGDVFAPITQDLGPDEVKRVAIEPIQFHLHVPSENAVDGNLWDGTLHIVNLVKDGESKKCDAVKKAGGLGCPVVLSVFLSASGTSSPLDPLVGWEADTIRKTGPGKYDSIFKKTGKEGAIDLGDEFDLTKLLPHRGVYVTWPGSLTTFPCTEGVLWVQFLEPMRLSRGMFKALQMAVAQTPGDDCKTIRRGKCAPYRLQHNNRELNPLNGRIVRMGHAF